MKRKVIKATTRVRAGIDRYDKDACGHERESVSSACKCITPIDYHCLNHHRRSTEDLNVRVDDSVSALLKDHKGGIL